MDLPDTVTVALPRDEFNEVVNLLQLIVVLGVQLYIRGIQPDKQKLSRAFDKMTEASVKGILEQRKGE